MPPKQSSTKRWVLTGFATGAAVPIGLGVYELYRYYIHLEPAIPGQGNCGSGAIVPLLLIVVVSPFLGMLGGVLGRIASTFFRRDTI